LISFFLFLFLQDLKTITSRNKKTKKTKRKEINNL